MTSPSLKIRPATARDLTSLVDLERASFTTDRFTREQIEHLLVRANATTLIIENSDGMLGSATMLWRKRSQLGRLYNIAISPRSRGLGLGKQLLAACEAEATWRRCDEVSLEVRHDNDTAIRFYRAHGYVEVETIDDYYEDGMAALRMIRSLTARAPAAVNIKAPYFEQSLEFTCGPACLLMAMKHLQPELAVNRRLELKLWQEATLIFMTSGIGGTDPFGLALAAHRRGFSSRVILSREQTPFYSSVRKPEKRKVIKIMHEDFRDRCLEAGVEVSYFDFSVGEIIAELHRGRMPIVLISSYRLHGDRSPHYVLLTGFDSENVFLNDPYASLYRNSGIQPRSLKVPMTDFLAMRRYGRDTFKAVIVIGRPWLSGEPGTFN